MTRRTTIAYQFVEHVPEELSDGIVYVSIPFATSVHLCCCGCRNEIVNPISPADWGLTFDGVSISLNPSVGAFSLPCRSHYWIRKNRVVWARPWSRREIEAGRERDQLALRECLDSDGDLVHDPRPAAVDARDKRPILELWTKVLKRLR